MEHDKKTVDSFITFIKNASDVVEKAKIEIKSLVDQGCVISPMQHEEISDFVVDMASDIDIIDDFNQRYEYTLWLRKFAPLGRKMAIDNNIS